MDKFGFIPSEYHQSKLNHFSLVTTPVGEKSMKKNAQKNSSMANLLA
jgi:hypothetical protein